MNSETVKLLEELGEKLGVGVSTLWSALLKQAPIEGALDLLWSGVFIAAGVFLVRRYMLNRGRWQGEYYDDGTFPALMVQSIITLVGLTFCVVIVSETLALGIAGLFNPEYWALHRVLSLLGGE